MNTDNIYIDKEDIAYAYDVCKTILDANVKNRAVENVVAANIADRFFDKSLYSVDYKSGLHNLAQVLDDIDISDIYVNGAYVDVRLYFEGSSPSVPSAHFKNGLLPAAYMFIKVSSDLSQGYLAGFIAPESIEQTDDEYYVLDENLLNSIYDVESRFNEKQESDEISELEIFKCAEGSLEDKISFYKKLIFSQSARNMFIKAVKAQSVFNFVSANPIEELKTDELTIIDSFDNNTDVIYEELSDFDNKEENYEYNTVAVPSETEDAESETVEPAEEEPKETEEATADDAQIDALFDSEQEDSEVQAPVKKKTSPLLYLLLIVLLGAGIFYAHGMFSQNNEQNVEEVVAENIDETIPAEESGQAESGDKSAMPVEDVNKVEAPQNKDEGNAISIPAIEKNLDASILVSNLKVDWEVPSGYASNMSAKRYLVKLGKVIQLNLKTELLLLTKPPISNKITVEIKYNNGKQKFEPVGIIASSGEKTVDDVILQTIRKALNMNISVNTSSFDKLQGNPILIIRL